METRVIRHLRAGWSDAILVCGKCSKKIDGGFGRKGRTPLAKALRRRFGLKKGPKGSLGVVETRCLGICPKHAVTVVRAGGWLAVAEGADIEQVGKALGLTPRK